MVAPGGNECPAHADHPGAGVDAAKGILLIGWGLTPVALC